MFATNSLLVDIIWYLISVVNAPIIPISIPESYLYKKHNKAVKFHTGYSNGRFVIGISGTIRGIDEKPYIQFYYPVYLYKLLT